MTLSLDFPADCTCFSDFGTCSNKSAQRRRGHSDCCRPGPSRDAEKHRKAALQGVMVPGSPQHGCWNKILTLFMGAFLGYNATVLLPGGQLENLISQTSTNDLSWGRRKQGDHVVPSSVCLNSVCAHTHTHTHTTRMTSLSSFRKLGVPKDCCWRVTSQAGAGWQNVVCLL